MSRPTRVPFKSEQNPMRHKLWENGPHVCVYCNRKLRWTLGRIDSASVEHIRPVAKNGHNGNENTALACVECNNLKGDFELFGLRGRLQYAEERNSPERKRLRAIVQTLEEFENY